jgi:hypothetical protein
LEGNFGNLRTFQRISNDGGKATNTPIIVMRASADMDIAIMTTLTRLDACCFQICEIAQSVSDIMNSSFPLGCLDRRDFIELESHGAGKISYRRNLSGRDDRFWSFPIEKVTKFLLNNVFLTSCRMVLERANQMCRASG